MTEESILPSDKILCACGLCNEIIDRFDGEGRERRFKNGHQCRGSNNAAWKGGRYITKLGYVRIKLHGHHRADRNGYVFEHILVMENILGRALDRDEVVHHINGNGCDNRPENLKLMKNQSQHKIAHRMDMSKRVCFRCKSRITVGRRWSKVKDHPGEYLCSKCDWRVRHPEPSYYYSLS